MQAMVPRPNHTMAKHEPNLFYGSLDQGLEFHRFLVLRDVDVPAGFAQRRGER